MVTEVTSRLGLIARRQSVFRAADSRSTSRLRALLARTDHAARVNLGMLALLAVWLAGELIIEGTAYTLVAVIPAAPVFAATVYHVRRGAEGTNWMLASGVLSGLLLLLCVASFYESLAMTPVDVTCAITSSVFAAVFGYAAGYQLLRGARGSEA